jgi:hypothetical protein
MCACVCSDAAEERDDVGAAGERGRAAQRRQVPHPERGAGPRGHVHDGGQERAREGACRRAPTGAIPAAVAPAVTSCALVGVLGVVPSPQMWSSTRWRNKIQNKKIGIKLFRSAVVSDDSEDDDDDDDDDSSDPDVARVGVASASRTTTPLSNAVIGRHARARAGAEALAHQPRNRTSVSPRTASAASSLSGFGSVHTGGGGATGTGTGSRSASLSGRSLSPSGGSSDVVTMADAADGLPPLPESARGALFPWRCGELLGQGRSGRVYKAMRSDTGELIAMKVR